MTLISPWIYLVSDYAVPRELSGGQGGMRSREEIEERLRKAEEKRAKLERECKDIADALELRDLETEIMTLRWVLGEQVEEEVENT